MTAASGRQWNSTAQLVDRSGEDSIIGEGHQEELLSLENIEGQDGHSRDGHVLQEERRPVVAGVRRQGRLDIDKHRPHAVDVGWQREIHRGSQGQMLRASSGQRRPQRASGGGSRRSSGCSSGKRRDPRIRFRGQGRDLDPGEAALMEVGTALYGVSAHADVNKSSYTYGSHNKESCSRLASSSPSSQRCSCSAWCPGSRKA